MVEVTKTKMRKWARGKEKGTGVLAMTARKESRAGYLESSHVCINIYHASG